MKHGMKRWAGAAAACMLLAVCTQALADSTDWRYSGRYGQVQLAAYAGDYDGYVNVDGFGGSSASDALRVSVISKNASIWQEPSTGSKRLASAGHGETMTCLSADGVNPQMENGFYAVDYKGKRGYVNAAYVVRNALVITLMESNVPAYIAPSSASKKVGSLSKQTSYQVVGFYDDYYIVRLRDAAVAYIPMSVRHYDTVFDEKYASAKTWVQITTNGKTALRTGPGSEYAEIRELSAGTSMNAMDIIDGWYLVWDGKGDAWAFVGEDAVM